MMLLQKPAEDTPLQVKLEHLADQIAKFGLAAAAAIFVSLVGKLLFQVWMGRVPLDVEVFNHIVKYIITSITVVVVAVPEGLPLAVTIALAYSMTKMLQDNNLVRHLEACETMGGSTTICSDKTGTLTTNRMTVVRAYAAGQVCDSAERLRDILGPDAAQLLWQGIAVNSTATEATNDKGVVEFVGSKTECALLGLLKTLGIDYLKLRDSIRKTKLIPFSSARKRMSTVARVPDGEFVFSKGASEIVLARCSHITTGKEIVPMTDAMREEVTKTISTFASQTLRTICLAYRPVSPDGDAKALDPAAPEELGETLEDRLIMLCIVGIKDPLRDEVPIAVRECKTAGIVVRMVTGDNIDTARAIASECGILTDGVIIEGPKFRALSEREREEIAPKLQVMARSSPTDKYMLVQALKRRGHVVAVTGDGTNDAPALKEANVGFAMGIAGTEVSKEASDIILMDDNFGSIVKAAMWGRNVYDSIRKFLQFQLTVNFVAVLLAFIGAITSTHGEPPLKPVQLLWVNLIMDTMAALALATDVPSPDLLKRKPYGKNDSLITPRMYANIIGQALFQLTVNLVVLYLGPAIFNVAPESVEHMTCVFNVFVICQLFNEINSRMLAGEFNVFAGFFRNTIFVAILAFTAVAQYLITEFGGDFTSTRPLSLRQWMTCVGIAALGVPVGMLIKLIPVPEPKPPKTDIPVEHKGSAIGAAGWAKVCVFFPYHNFHASSFSLLAPLCCLVLLCPSLPRGE
jgi:Ca2+-transporting ATPase